MMADRWGRGSLTEAGPAAAVTFTTCLEKVSPGTCTTYGTVAYGYVSVSTQAPDPVGAERTIWPQPPSQARTAMTTHADIVAPDLPATVTLNPAPSAPANSAPAPASPGESVTDAAYAADQPTGNGSRPDLEPEPGTTFERVLVATFVAVPMLALLAAVPLAWGWGLGWHDIVIAVVFYAVSGLGISMGFHRYFTHGSS